MFCSLPCQVVTYGVYMLCWQKIHKVVVELDLEHIMQIITNNGPNYNKACKMISHSFRLCGRHVLPTQSIWCWRQLENFRSTRLWQNHPQKWGVRLPGSRSGNYRRSENACKHTYEALKIIISLKIKLLHFSLYITRMRSRRCFKRYNMFVEGSHSTIKGIQLAIEVKTSFDNSMTTMGSNMESST
jgi:hypothetical protein